MGIASSAPRISEHDKQVLRLKAQRDRLAQCETRIAAQVAKELQLARAHLALGNQPAARIALGRKNTQLALLERTGAQLLLLEQLTVAIESAVLDKQLLQGLENGQAALTKLNRDMDVASVEQLMADTADAVAYQESVQALISGGLTENDNDEALLVELDDLVQAEVIYVYIAAAGSAKCTNHQTSKRSDIYQTSGGVSESRKI